MFFFCFFLVPRKFFGTSPAHRRREGGKDKSDDGARQHAFVAPAPGSLLLCPATGTVVGVDMVSATSLIETQETQQCSATTHTVFVGRFFASSYLTGVTLPVF